MGLRECLRHQRQEQCGPRKGGMSSDYRLMDVSLEPEVQNQVWARRWPSGGPTGEALLPLPASGRSSYSVACGCVAAVSAFMVTSESSVFLQGHQSLGQGHLTSGTDPPALELKTIKQNEKIILENLSISISILKIIV